MRAMTMMLSGLLVVAACDAEEDQTSPQRREGSGGAGAPTAAQGGSAGAGAACPDAIPLDGSPCDDLGLRCSWGDHPIVECRPSAECVEGRWRWLAGRAMHLCPPTLPEGCPEAPSPNAACEARPPADICVYDDGTRCDCLPCSADDAACVPGQSAWQCAKD